MDRKVWNALELERVQTMNWTYHHTGYSCGSRKSNPGEVGEQWLLMGCRHLQKSDKITEFSQRKNVPKK